MNFAVGIIIGLFIGGTFGFLGSALCIASSNYNQVEELNNMLDDFKIPLATLKEDILNVWGRL